MAAEGLKIQQVTLQERLEKLNKAEQQICDVLEAAASFVGELSKEKQPTKTVMETYVNRFKEKLNCVESELNSQIDYLSNVSVGTAHEGSSFLQAQEKVAADHRLNHIKHQFNSLDCFKPNSSDDT